MSSVMYKYTFKFILFFLFINRSKNRIGSKCLKFTFMGLICVWCIFAQFNLFEYAFTIPQFPNSMDISSDPPPTTPSKYHSHSDGSLHDTSDAPKQTDKVRLASLCPLRRNLCIRDNHWVTPYKDDIFNVSELMFGTGIHQKYKVYRDNMYATYDPLIVSNGECLMVNESMIILHAWYPHMLWEVWNRIATQLFQYQVLEQFLSKEHRFAIMQLQTPYGLDSVYNLGTVHDLLLSPFTNYPFVHLKSLMWNQTNSLYEYGITKHVKFYDILDYPERMTHYEPMYSPKGDCTCIEETFWCGFDQDLKKDVKQIPSIFDGLGQHEFGEFSWDMARWYKWYFIKTYGTVPQHMVDKKTKPRLLFIQRRSWKRVWANLEQTVRDCTIASHGLFECIILYFEDISHIQAIWTMQLTDILIGIHGSGLVNGIFMNERATLLEIIPRHGPDYLFNKRSSGGSIMTWIYKYVPQRHAWFPLLDEEQVHFYMRDWQKPFNVTWQRLEPVIKYLLETPHDFCPKIIPKNLKDIDFGIGKKDFPVKSPLYPYRPSCNSYEYLTM